MGKVSRVEPGRILSAGRNCGFRDSAFVIW
jgi:hypothetical protein